MMWYSRIKLEEPNKRATRNLSMCVHTSHFGAQKLTVMQDLLRSDFHKKFMVWISQDLNTFGEVLTRV